MWNWLLLVGSDGKPDTYTKITNINFPSVFLGIIIGMLISAFIAFIIVIKNNSKKQKHNKTEETQINNTQNN